MVDFTPTPSSQPASAAGPPPSAPATVPADRGLAWWSEGWRLFTAAPLMWVAITVVGIALMVLIGMIPILGSVATTVLGPVFAGGVLLGCRSLDEGGPLRLDHLFACFAERLMPLLVLGLLYLAGSAVIVIAVGICLLLSVGFGGLSALMSGDALTAGMAMLSGVGLGMLFALLLGALLGIPLTMAVWFAEALIVFRNDDPVAAMRASFAACLVDWISLLVYSVVGLGLAIVASIPFMLGWLVLVPVFAGSWYASYKEIFGSPAQPSA